ncbi:MAG: response regulator transcription factor [Verrucomicrobiaceae bacterium]|jgi:CheY-like chemotaxis protein|nr:response regulator transcription factor [Verrucomicrobiaceae bacterium]
MAPEEPRPISPVPGTPARVLLAEESLPFRRVIREALTAFCQCEVDDTPSGEHAFEMALRREYALFIFSMPLPDIAGDLLDRLLAKAYPLAHPAVHTAPPVVYLLRPADLAAFEQIKRDVRVRGSLAFPPRLDQLMALTGPLLPARAAPAGSVPFPPPFAP